MARLVYDPADGGPEVESERFTFIAPLGPIEAEDLTWYLERYYRWPIGVFRERAAGVEAQLPRWGEKLYTAAVGQEKAREVFAAWQHANAAAERRFSVRVDDESSPGVAPGEAAEVATELLALPWDLLHDKTGWLFQGGQPVRVRRRLPNRRSQPVRETEPPARILLLSPRPVADGEGNPIGYLDHRASALPLVEAVEGLGELVRLTVLHPPTYAALEQALDEGDDGHPFDVVHFDGHGVYDRRSGLGGLLAGLVRAHHLTVALLEVPAEPIGEKAGGVGPNTSPPRAGSATSRTAL